jgi:hypothetical protein
MSVFKAKDVLHFSFLWECSYLSDAFLETTNPQCEEDLMGLRLCNSSHDEEENRKR